MIWILDLIINCANVVMVDTMLNVLEIFMSDWHTHLKKLVSDSFGWVLEHISELIILLFKLFSCSQLGVLVVNLSQLLHLEVVLTYKVLLLLREISKILGWCTSIDLACWNSITVSQLGTCSKHAEALDC